MSGGCCYIQILGLVAKWWRLSWQQATFLLSSMASPPALEMLDMILVLTPVPFSVFRGWLLPRASD